MRTNILNFTAFMLILAGIVYSCRKAEVNGNVNSVNITLMETFDPSSRTLQLKCLTARNYAYGCYPILFEYNQRSNNINIIFKGVREDIPEGMSCPAMEGPASAFINLGYLNNGTYRLNLSSGSVRRSGELIVSPNGYRIKFPNNPNFRFTNTSLTRTQD